VRPELRADAGGHAQVPRRNAAAVYAIAQAKEKATENSNQCIAASSECATQAEGNTTR